MREERGGELMAVWYGVCGALGALAFAFAALMFVPYSDEDGTLAVPLAWKVVPLAIGVAAWSPIFVAVVKWYMRPVRAWKALPPITLDSGWSDNPDDRHAR